MASEGDILVSTTDLAAAYKIKVISVDKGNGVALVEVIVAREDEKLYLVGRTYESYEFILDLYYKVCNVSMAEEQLLEVLNYTEDT